MNREELRLKISQVIDSSNGQIHTDLADFILANFTPKESYPKSLEVAAFESTMGHSSSHNDSFKEGARWALQNTPKGEAEKVTAKEVYLAMLEGAFSNPAVEKVNGEKMVKKAYLAAKAFNEKPE